MFRTVTAFVFALVIAAAPARAQSNPFVESIGALAAAQLYTTASYLDVTMEALVRDAYKPKDVRVALDRMAGMTDNIGRYLTQVLQTNLAKEDAEFLQEAVAVYGLLKTESQALHRFAGTRAEPDKAAFHRAREVAWTRLKALLKLP